MSELKTRVDELKMENEYQLRLKDMNYNEKIKDLTDKFLQEIESLKAKNEVNSKSGDEHNNSCGAQKPPLKGHPLYIRATFSHCSCM